MKINIKKGYAELRKEAYGTLEDQLDYMAHHGAEALIARNLAIKLRIPKDQ